MLVKIHILKSMLLSVPLNDIFVTWHRVRKFFVVVLQLTKKKEKQLRSILFDKRLNWFYLN